MRKTWTYHKVLIKTLLTYHVLSKVEVAAETARHQPIVIDQPVPTRVSATCASAAVFSLRKMAITTPSQLSGQTMRAVLQK